MIKIIKTVTQSLFQAAFQAAPGFSPISRISMLCGNSFPRAQLLMRAQLLIERIHNNSVNFAFVRERNELRHVCCITVSVHLLY